MSVPSKKLYSASEIGQMKLPGLPTSKARVIDRARVEEWDFEEVKGVGGTRKMYEIPEHYLRGAPGPMQKAVLPIPKVAGTVAGGTNRVDLEKLELAITALSEWEQERHVKISADRRSAVIALLYEYLETHADEGAEAMNRVLRVL